MEKSVKLKAAGSVAGAVLMVGSAVAAVPGAAIAQCVDVPDAQASFNQDAAELGLTEQAMCTSQRVEGVFSFDQDAVTSNQEIADVFQKAAATLCQTLPEYGATETSGAIEVNAPQSSFVATADELSEDDGVGAIVGCACATNAPGGGAIANAEVRGIALETLAIMARAF